MGKKISELRVVDLKEILEKRGLEKTGIKSVLVERLSKALVEEGHDPNTFTLDDNEAANDSQLSETGNAEGDTSVTEEDPTPGVDGQVKEVQETDEAADSSLVELGDPEEPEQVVEEPVDSEKPVENPAADAESGVVSQEEERVAETGEAVEHELVTNDEEAAEQTSILEDADSFEPISDSAAAEALNEAADNNLVKSTVADDEVETVIDTDTNKEDPSKESEAENELLNTAMDSEVDQFVVHVDESDTNLDYDLGDKAEERDAPTPTKDESMDVDASDIVQSEEHSASVTVTATSQAEKSEATSSTPTSATKSLSDVRVDVPKRDSKDLAASQNLWISNLSSLTRATDLKAVFSKHGKVIGAKVVTNANRPGAKCYGYVTMSSPEEAAKCIQNLHRTELHGRMISVEKAKSDPAAQARAATIRKPVGTDDKKKEDSVAASAPKDETTSVDHKDDAGATDEVNGPTSTDDKTRVSDRLRPVRPPITGPGRKEGESEVRDGSQKPVDKPRKSTPERKAEEALDREKRRLKLQERRARDDDYRRRTALLKEKRMLADQQRNLRMEETRMAREREKLRLDREKCKIEEMKLEGLHQERTRLENLLDDLRQRVDREREELKRVETLRLEEIRRSSSLKRPYEGSGGRSSGGSGRYDDGWESKRPATNERYTAGSVDRRGATNVSSGDRGYGDRRPAHEMDRRTVSVKDAMVSRGGRSDDRYGGRGSGGSGDRRDYVQADTRNRDPSRSDWKPPQDSRGPSRDYHESSSRRGANNVGWGGGGASSGPPSLLGAAGGELFSGSAAAQAAGMMMTAAMSRGSTTNGNGGRYAGGGSGGSYASARRY